MPSFDVSEVKRRYSPIDEAAATAAQSAEPTDLSESETTNESTKEPKKKGKNTK